MITKTVTIDVRRETGPTPNSWGEFTPGLREIWSVSLETGDTFNELEPFSAATAEMYAWGKQHELGFVPIIQAYRWSTYVIWLCALSMSGELKADWRCYWFCGDSYNGVVSEGDYRQLPELPSEAFRIILALSVFPMTEWPLLAEVSPFQSVSVFCLEAAFVSWYGLNVFDRETGKICGSTIQLSLLNDSDDSCVCGVIKWVLDDPQFTEVNCSVIESQGDRYLRFELNPSVVVPFRDTVLARYLDALDFSNNRGAGLDAHE